MSSDGADGVKVRYLGRRRTFLLPSGSRLRLDRGAILGGEIAIWLEETVPSQVRREAGDRPERLTRDVPTDKLRRT